MVDIGVLPGFNNSNANDISDKTEIVGYSYDNESNLEPTGFYYSPSLGMLDLSNITSPSVKITSAQKINNCQQILADGYNFATGYSGKYLLSPKGFARVFNPNPIRTSGDESLQDNDGSDPFNKLLYQTQCVTLQGLYGPWDAADPAYDPNTATEPPVSPIYMLTGEYVSTEATSDRIKQAVPVFDYDRTQPGFQEVNAYYHVDACLRYASTLSPFFLPETSNTQSDAVKLPIKINTTAGTFSTFDNTGYSPIDNTIKLSTFGVDAAEDGEVLWHETAHALQVNLALQGGAAPKKTGKHIEFKAAMEGMADYWALSQFADIGKQTHMLKWAQWFGGDRDYELSLHYPESMTTFWTDNGIKDIHEAGMIWGQALWNIRDKIGRQRADYLALQLFFDVGADISTASFKTFAKKLLNINYVKFNGEYDQSIKEELFSRGILREISSIDLNNSNVTSGDKLKITVNFSAKSLNTETKSLQLFSDKPDVITVPPVITIPAANIDPFGNPINGDNVVLDSILVADVTQETIVKITASYDGESIKTIDITVKPKPVKLSSFVADFTQVKSGSEVILTINTSGMLSNDEVIMLTSNNDAISVPASVVIPSGSSSIQVVLAVGKVLATTDVILTAGCNGSSKELTVTVFPKIELSSFTATPNPVNSGAQLAVTVNLVAKSSIEENVLITSSNPSISFSKLLNIPVGNDFGTLTTQVGNVNTETTVTITAKYEEQTKSVDVIIKPNQTITQKIISAVQKLVALLLKLFGR